MGKKSDVVLPAREHTAREERKDVVAWVKGREARYVDEVLHVWREEEQGDALDVCVIAISRCTNSLLVRCAMSLFLSCVSCSWYSEPFDSA